MIIYLENIKESTLFHLYLWGKQKNDAQSSFIYLFLFLQNWKKKKEEKEEEKEKKEKRQDKTKKPKRQDKKKEKTSNMVSWLRGTFHFGRKVGPGYDLRNGLSLLAADLDFQKGE